MLKGLAAINAKIEALKEFQNSKESIAIDAVMEEKNVVLDMNFNDQLETEGVDSGNVPIMRYEPYAPSTIELKKRTGRPYDRVTLNQDGDFHDGAELTRLNDTEAYISSGDSKTGFLVDRYGERIFGLKPDNFNEIKLNYVYPYLIKEFENILQKHS